MDVSDFIIDRLAQWGVRLIYGYPGEAINDMMGALNRRSEQMRFIQVRHGEMASFMACAHGRLTGEPGVCLAGAGGGAIQLLNGLYDAKKDGIPVVAIVGQQSTTSIGADYQQEIDLLSLFKDVAGAYVHLCSTPAAVRHQVDQAMRIATSHRTVTCVIVPHDVQSMTMSNPPRRHGSVFSGVGFRQSATVPPPEALEQAAAVLNESRKLAILIGSGAADAADEVVEVANRLGAGIAKALLGKAVLPDDLPFVTGSIGLLGTRPTWEMMNDCDTLLMVGTNFPYAEFLPPEGQARAVQIDINPRNLGLRYPTEINLHGTARETLQRLLPLLTARPHTAWREKIEKDVARWWNVLEERAMNAADPINPQRVFWELSPRLPERCIVTVDSGTSINWFARDIRMRSGMRVMLSGGLATMGPAIPYAVAAKYAAPERDVVAILGDGTMRMSGLAALAVVADTWKQWENPRLLVLVLNNQDLSFTSWEQRVMEGDPKFTEAQRLPPYDYAAFARSLGLLGRRVENPEDVAPAFDEAFLADRPVLVEVATDPNVPPLPPHIEVSQAVLYARAILKGDPEAWDAIRQSLKDTMSSVTGSVKR